MRDARVDRLRGAKSQLRKAQAGMDEKGALACPERPVSWASL